MRQRLPLLFAVVVVLTACDGYIEEARVSRDGGVEFAARGTVVCTDPLQQEVWGGNPCDTIDDVIRTGDIGALPFEFELDPDRVGLVGTGETDRRVIDATWSGTIDELSTVLISSGTIRVIDEVTTEAIFVPESAPADRLRSSSDPAIIDERRSSRWAAGQFRVRTPDLVVEHNGDEIQGRIVIWDVDDDRPDEFRVVWTTEDPPRRLWWWAMGTMILSIILFMMITIERPGSGVGNDGDRGV